VTTTWERMRRVVELDVAVVVTSPMVSV
jgi:hypothetical protein